MKKPAPIAPLTDLAAARRFLVAGHAIFTMVSKLTGKSITYKARALPKHPKYGPAIGVSYLVGSENTDESSYKYLGTLREVDADAALTFKAKNPEVRGASLEGIEWLVRVMNANNVESFAKGVEFLHAGRCAVCGRLLTTKASILTGIGPKCAGRE